MVDGQATALPKPNFPHPQTAVELQTVYAAAGNNHLNRQVGKILIHPNAVALIGFAPRLPIRPAQSGRPHGEVFGIGFQKVDQQQIPNSGLTALVKTTWGHNF